MPKINFNVPYLTSHGEPVRRPKTDTTKARLDATGNPRFTIVSDEEGNVVFENVMVNDMLVQVLDSAFEGDNNLPFPDRAKRGKLSRKVADTTKGSLKNYSIEELAVIKELTAKIGASTLIAQLDDIIEGEQAEEEKPQKSEEVAA